MLKLGEGYYLIHGDMSNNYVKTLELSISGIDVKFISIPTINRYLVDIKQILAPIRMSKSTIDEIYQAVMNLYLMYYPFSIDIPLESLCYRYTINGYYRNDDHMVIEINKVFLATIEDSSIYIDIDVDWFEDLSEKLFYFYNLT